MQRVDFKTDEGLEFYAVRQLELYLYQLREHKEVPPIIHFVVQRDPDTGETLSEPKAHVVSYERLDGSSKRAQEHLAKSLEACAMVTLAFEPKESRVVLGLRTAEWSSLGYCDVEEQDGELQFGDLTPLEPPESPKDNNEEETADE